MMGLYISLHCRLKEHVGMVGLVGLIVYYSMFPKTYTESGVGRLLG